MKDQNVRQEAIKILEEKESKNLFDLGCSNFTQHVSRGKGNKSKSDLLGPHQNKKSSAQQRKQSAKVKGN